MSQDDTNSHFILDFVILYILIELVKYKYAIHNFGNKFCIFIFKISIFEQFKIEFKALKDLIIYKLSNSVQFILNP